MGGKSKVTGESAPSAGERLPGRKMRLRRQPAPSAKGRDEAAERQERLAAALRANLCKRRAQLAARRADSSAARPPAPLPDPKRR